MWRRIVDWHRGWEEEQLAVLEQPAVAATLQPGFRRRLAETIGKMSDVERQQLHAFALANRGRRGYITMAKLLLCFTACGALAHLLLPATGLGLCIAVANLLGLELAVAMASAWFNYRKLAQGKWKAMARMTVLVLAGALVGVATMAAIGGKPSARVLGNLPRIAAMALGAGILASAPMIVVGVLRNRQYEMLTAQLQAEAERERLARELSESKLRLLRAQIEPHFLFNTLGAVQQLAQHGAPRAAELTANLIAFLRASLGDMRSDQVSLSGEFGLVESYLKVMQARLGERLRFSLTLPRALEQVRVPSMILLTLAENAVKHGIEPALRGGGIAVSAEVDGELLRLSVRDSGIGMSITSSNGAGRGMGLQNVRDRLRLAYGEGGTLSLEDLDPGLLAEVAIPHPAAQQGQA